MKNKHKNEKTNKAAPPKFLRLGKDKEYFIENVSMLVDSGTSIVDSLIGVRQDMRSKSTIRMIDYIIKEVENGSPFWKAINRLNVFSKHISSLIRIGEQSGRLAENLKMIALQEEKDRLFKSKFKSAMMYPVLILSLTVLVGAGIAWFILPRLASVFSSLRIELPAVTRGLIYLGIFFADYGHIFIPIFIIFFICLVYFLFFNLKTRFVGQTVLFYLPAIKEIVQQIEVSRFGFLLGTLLEAGVPITDALDSLRTSATIPTYSKFYSYLYDSIKEGNSFQKAFKKHQKANKYIAFSAQKMIISGEQSGRLSDVLIKIGHNYENRIEMTTKNLSTLLEPLLLVIVWLGVVAVALAVILPIYSLIGGLN